jgi:predicted DsbA family dithiol-disulfide isomerase
MTEPLTIAVFSDPICPWCFLGKRRLERALTELDLMGTALIRWLPFELNPTMPLAGMERTAYRAAKFGPDRAAALDRDMAALGAEEGISFAFDRIERTPNTRRAHVLMAHASRQGLGGAAAETLFRAYFEEALDIGRDDVLADVAARVGLDREAALAALGDQDLLASIVDLEEEAGRLGIGGVPFFILNDAWSVAGAQATSVWREVLPEILNAGASEGPAT